MVTEQDYLAAKKVVEEWLKAQPQDSKYPYKPKVMSTQDYARQRALNEVFRHLIENDIISLDEFSEIINRFDLLMYEARNGRNETVNFIRWEVAYNVFSLEKVKSDSKVVYQLSERLKDNDVDGNFIDTSKMNFRKKS
ncbi:MAG: hypothetical protein H7Y42_12575 [Chitinophagaceae bacterium]|nr:hypothetical protein [Chitinophagaceae bacterium]